MLLSFFSSLVLSMMACVGLSGTMLLFCCGTATLTIALSSCALLAALISIFKGGLQDQRNGSSSCGQQTHRERERETEREALRWVAMGFDTRFQPRHIHNMVVSILCDVPRCPWRESGTCRRPVPFPPRLSRSVSLFFFRCAPK